MLIMGNTTAKPATCTIGALIFDTVNDKPFVCAAGNNWKPLDSDGDKDGLVDWIDPNDASAHQNVCDAGGTLGITKACYDYAVQAANIKSGKTIFGVAGTFQGEGRSCDGSAWVNRRACAGSALYTFNPNSAGNEAAMKTLCAYACAQVAGANCAELNVSNPGGTCRCTGSGFSGLVVGSEYWSTSCGGSGSDLWSCSDGWNNRTYQNCTGRTVYSYFPFPDGGDFAGYTNCRGRCAAISGVTCFHYVGHGIGSPSPNSCTCTDGAPVVGGTIFDFVAACVD